MSDSEIPLGDGKFAVAIDRPATIDELQDTVRARVGQGHAIYPQGGCTSLDFGDPPAREGVAISTRGLARVIDYPHEDMTITVEAGMTMAEIDRILSVHNQRLCIDAPMWDRATIGGVYATNWTGPKRFGLGRPRDQVIGISFVNSAGELIHGGGRVVKNVAGYDFPKLLTGSMGTLGIISELTLKVRPKPEASIVVVVRIESLKLAQSLDCLNTSKVRPVAIEVLCKSMESPIASVTERRWDLAVGLEGTKATVDWERDILLAELRPFIDNKDTSFVREAEHEREYWDVFAAEMQSPHQLSMRANIRPSMVGDFLNGLNHDQWLVQSHAGSGVVQANLVGSFDLEQDAVGIDRIREFVRACGGSLTLPTCPTAWKPRLKVWSEPHPDWAIAERIKQALDPLGVMNPGRFVGRI